MRAAPLRTRLLAVTSLLFALNPVAATSEIVPDEHGVVLEVPADIGDHWVWVGDRLLRHSTLFDGDSGRVLGMVDITWTLGGETPLVARGRGEVYVVEPVLERGHRGSRTDYVTIYDARGLDVIGEVELPTQTAMIGHGLGVAAVLDGERFLVIFNQKPATSVSVVDLETRSFSAEIPTAGCALVYPVAASSFGMLCGDGTAMRVDLDDSGRLAATARSTQFFDSVDDPITEKGVRDGGRWLFASFAGRLHAVDFMADPPLPEKPWPLFADDSGTWRVGGARHLALHRKSRRLYSLVHEGGPGSHKDAGSEIRVYDIDSHEHVQTISAPSLLPSFLRPYAGLERGSLTYRVLGFLLPNLGIHSIAVTQDDAPLLFTRHNELGAIGVLDATTGAHLRDLEEAGLGGGGLAVP